MKIVNPFESPGQWYKANLHTHTTISDGIVSVEERVQQYRQKGYAVLAITDHSQTNSLDGLSSKDFLVINGMETGDKADVNKRNPYHLVCLNVPYDFKLPKNASANTRIKLVKKAGGEVIIGHPYWNGHHLKHLLAINGYIGLEVYNTTCHGIGKGISSVYWDDLLDAGRIVPGIACDDAHGYDDAYQGWTMLKAKELSVKSIMKALRIGCFYSSCGPVIKDIRIKNGKLVLCCSPVTEIYFMSQRSFGGRVLAKKGETLTKSAFPLEHAWKYIRVELVDAQGQRAWSNPFIL